MKEKYKKLLASVAATMVISVIVFFVLQGVVVDLIDEYVIDTIYVEKISILTYIVFIYSFTFYVSILVISLITSENAKIIKKNLHVNTLALAFTIAYMSLVSFLFAGYGLRYYFSQITFLDKLLGFYIWNSYFIAYVLGDSTWYFVMLSIMYMYSYSLFYLIANRGV